MTMMTKNLRALMGGFLLLALAGGMASAQPQIPWIDPGLFMIDTEASAPQEASLPPAENHCERGSFEAFFARFAEDVDQQYRNTAFPLRVDYTNPFEPGNESELQTMYVKPDDSGQSRQPIFPPEWARVDRGSRYTIKARADGRMVVTLYPQYQEDTGPFLDYVFTWNNCWRLTAIAERAH